MAGLTSANSEANIGVGLDVVWREQDPYQGTDLFAWSRAGFWMPRAKIHHRLSNPTSFLFLSDSYVKFRRHPHSSSDLGRKGQRHPKVQLSQPRLGRQGWALLRGWQEREEFKHLYTIWISSMARRPVKKIIINKQLLPIQPTRSSARIIGLGICLSLVGGLGGDPLHEPLLPRVQPVGSTSSC